MPRGAPGKETIGRVSCCAPYLRYPAIIILVGHGLHGGETTNDSMIDEFVVPCSSNHCRYPHDLPMRYPIGFNIIGGDSATNHITCGSEETTMPSRNCAFTRRTRGSHCPVSLVQIRTFAESSPGYIPKISTQKMVTSKCREGFRAPSVQRRF